MTLFQRSTSIFLLSGVALGGPLACTEEESSTGDGGAGSTAGNTGMTSTAGSTSMGGLGGGGAAGNAAAGMGGLNMSSAGSSAGGSGNMATAGAGGMADAGGLPGGSLSPDSGADAGRVAFRISSPDFDNIEGCGPDGAAPDICGRFDNDNTRFGADLSPEFNWTPGPEGTQSYALALHDLSFNMNGGPFTHWVIWNIPASESGLAAAFLGGTLPGIPAANTEQRSFEADNEFTGSGGAGNVYEFVLYALSANSVDFANENSTDVIQDALDASGALLGTTTMRARSNP